MGEFFGVLFIAIGASFGVAFLINQLQKRGVFVSRKRQYTMLNADLRATPRILGIISISGYVGALVCASLMAVAFCVMVVMFLPLLISGQFERYFSEGGFFPSLMGAGYGLAWLGIAIGAIMHLATVLVLNTIKVERS